MSKPPYNVELVKELRGLLTDPAKLAEFDQSYALIADDFVESTYFLMCVS